MKNLLLTPIEFLGNASRHLHFLLMAKSEEYAKLSLQRNLMMVSATITLTCLCVVNVVHAEDGLAGMADTAAQQGESIKTSLGKLFSAIGFGGAGLGAYNWWRKGKEGEQSHIKGSQIFVPILAGAALGATGFLMIKAGETIGIQSSSQGQIPQ